MALYAVPGKHGDSIMTYLSRLITIVLCTLLFCLHAQAASIDDISERLLVLETREEIRALILAYGRAHDGRDYQAFAALFAKEGEWIGGMGSAKGPDAIFKLMDESIGHNPQPEGSGTFHIMSNEQIDVAGDRASSVTKWVYVTKSADNTPSWTYLGHYVDQFIRENGVWKFLRRQSFRDIPTG
jgi:uncharacterized protein (TIGR02246 family)